MCVIPSPKTGFSSSPLQLTLWHSSCLLSGLLDLKVSCSMIYLLLRNKLLFSSDPLILPSCCHGAARLDSGGITCVGEILSVLPDTQALCRPARLLLNDALPKKECTEEKLKPQKKGHEPVAGIFLSLLSPHTK